eukprot:m.125797 g.125797  ORF g.125797 m.125797 type:complete len:62 (+) comp29153_c0_seq3:257-442(+)
MSRKINLLLFMSVPTAAPNAMHTMPKKQYFDCASIKMEISDAPRTAAMTTSPAAFEIKGSA